MHLPYTAHGCGPGRATWTVAAALLMGFPGPAGAEPVCKVIQFQRGATSAQVHGVAPAADAECLRFGAGRGQRVEVSVQSARDQVVFSIDGLVDARTQHRFTSEKKDYRLRVAQLMRAVAPVPYVLTLSIQ